MGTALPALWRTVYQKAAAQAAQQTAAKLDYHVYTYHPDGPGSPFLTQDEGDVRYAPLGDSMRNPMTAMGDLIIGDRGDSQNVAHVAAAGFVGTGTTTGSGTGTVPGYPVANAFDDTDATEWRSNNLAASWTVHIDLGTGWDTPITHWRLAALGTNPAAGDRAIYDVQSSP